VVQRNVTTYSEAQPLHTAASSNRPQHTTASQPTHTAAGSAQGQPPANGA
jgi:hypothetical protein